MPDITMCNGGSCPKKQECYRHNANPSTFRQSYFVDVPVKQDGTCDHHWPDKWAEQGKKWQKESVS